MTRQTPGIPVVNTPVTLAGFAAGLVAVSGTAAGLGAVAGPVGPASADAGITTGHGGDATGHGGTGHEAGAAEGAADDGELPAGLLVSDNGYTLDLLTDVAPSGSATPLALRILDPQGHPVTAYRESHEQDLHLIAVRRDLSGFQHVHPALGTEGVWTTPLSLTPGSWRVFADFEHDSVVRTAAFTVAATTQRGHP